jgi:hypothetical protein
MRYRALALAGALLAAASLACSVNLFGGGEETPPPAAPTQPPVETEVPAGPGLDSSAPPNFGSVGLAAGFAPDPHTVPLAGGGDIDVGALNLGGKCEGYATRAPDFRVEWSGTSENLRIFFVADGGEDATLIVNDANGDWRCNDDSPFGGLDPLVDLPDPSGGPVDVWVGTYESGQYIEGTLYVTELDYHAGSLPGEEGPTVAGLPYEDDFSDPGSGWEVGEDEGGSVGYGDGYYFVTSVNEGKAMWGLAQRHFTDVMIDVDTIQISAPANNNNAYGVKCRVQTEEVELGGDGYALLISGDGYYSIQLITGGDYEALVPWTQSGAIRQGNAANHVRAVCDGTRLALFVNEEFLAEAEDDTYASGDISLMAATLEAEPTEIHFGNLAVVEPPPVLPGPSPTATPQPVGPAPAPATSPPPSPTPTQTPGAPSEALWMSNPNLMECHAGGGGYWGGRAEWSVGGGPGAYHHFYGAVSPGQELPGRFDEFTGFPHVMTYFTTSGDVVWPVPDNCCPGDNGHYVSPEGYEIVWYKVLFTEADCP